MTTDSQSDILAVIRSLYEALDWDADKTPDWDSFKACFHETARLYPSARPLEAVDINTFVARMDAQRANGNLAAFSETMLGEQIQIFGNVAVAFSAYETLMNHKTRSRGLNAFHLARDGGEWKVISLAWDNEGEDQPLPDLSGR